MSDENKKVCNQCPNHCPITDLKCSEGRMALKRESQGRTEYTEKEGRRGPRGHHGERGHHKGRMHGGHHGGGRPCMDEDTLPGLMQACGHQIYHRGRRGGGQEGILSILAEKEQMSQKDLQEILQIQPGSMSEILMKLEQKDHPAAQEAAKRLYSRVEMPYQLYPGYNTDAMDYQLLLSFLIVLFCTVIAAPIFTSDYQTGADDIYRCTKYGRVKFAITKLLSALLICGTAFSLCAVVFLLVSNSLYGWECTKTSIQMLYSIVNLPNLNLGQLQWVCAGGYLLCLLATVSFTLFLSSRLRNVVASLAVALVCCILPVILYVALPSEIGQWIYTILPAGGVALQTSFLYTLVDFAFWNIGNIAIWTPYVMLGAYCVEIPLFLCLAVYSYCTRKV